MKFKKEKLINLDNADKAAVGKKYYFFDSIELFKDCVDSGDVNDCIVKDKLKEIDIVGSIAPFKNKHSGNWYSYIYPVKKHKKHKKQEQISKAQISKAQISNTEKPMFDLNKLIWNGNKEQAVKGKEYYAFTNINQFAEDFEREDIVIQTFDFCELNDAAVTIRPFIVYNSISDTHDDVPYLYPIPGEEY